MSTTNNVWKSQSLNTSTSEGNSWKGSTNTGCARVTKKYACHHTKKWRAKKNKFKAWRDRKGNLRTKINEAFLKWSTRQWHSPHLEDKTALKIAIYCCYWELNFRSFKKKKKKESQQEIYSSSSPYTPYTLEMTTVMPVHGIINLIKSSAGSLEHKQHSHLEPHSTREF